MILCKIFIHNAKRAIMMIVRCFWLLTTMGGTLCHEAKSQPSAAFSRLALTLTLMCTMQHSMHTTTQHMMHSTLHIHCKFNTANLVDNTVIACTLHCSDCKDCTNTQYSTPNLITDQWNTSFKQSDCRTLFGAHIVYECKRFIVQCLFQAMFSVLQCPQKCSKNTEKCSTYLENSSIITF